MTAALTVPERRRWRSPAWLAVLVALCISAPALAQGDAPLVIRAAKVITVSGKTIEPGAVLVRDGKIVSVGRRVDAPPGARIIDAPDGVVIPGLVAAFTTLAEGSRDTELTATPELCVAEGLNTYGDWRAPLSGGVTTVYLSPPGGRIVPGRGAVAKLGDGSPSARLLEAPSPLRIVLGEWPKNPPAKWDPPLPPTADNPSSPPVKQLPSARAGEMAFLRKLFRGEGDGATDPSVRAALEGKLTVRIRADRLEDIRSALELAEAFKLRVMLESGTEAYEVADELARREIAVVLLPSAQPSVREYADSSGVLGRERLDTAARLVRAGVRTAVSTDDGSLGSLLSSAAWLVGEGMPAEDALRSITLTAAEVLGVAGSVGSIEEGKDGDLVVLTGDPFATRTRVLATVSDGRVVYDRLARETPEAASPLLIIRAKTVLPGTGGAVTDGEIRIRDGKVICIGGKAEAPKDAEIVELGERVVMPGIIDIHSHLGLHWESDDPTLSPGAAVTDPAGGPKTVSIACALDPNDPAFAEALQAGVTSVAVAPGTSGAYCGSVAVVKTGGGRWEDRVVAPVAALEFSMGDLRGAATVAGQLRDLLGRAKQYDTAWTEFDKRWAEFERKYAVDPKADLKEPDRPGRDGELELMRGLFRDGIPALVQADQLPLIRHAITVFKREFGLNVIILGASDAFRMAPELRAARVGCALGLDPLYRERGRETCVPAVAADAGVPVAFQSASPAGSHYLRMAAANAVRNGMKPADALRAITVTPAELLGLGRRMGSLEPGRDADFVVLSGDPLEPTSRVERTYIGGRLVYDAGAGER
jgi:imidazolonepropionase-like amidohydrolase